MTRNRCQGWAHGDPVTYPARDGSVISVGKVIIRKSLNTGRPYLKIRVQSIGSGEGEWAWPEGWVIGQGPHAGTCLECGQEFRTAEKDPSGFCLPCNRSFAQSIVAGSDIRRPGAYLHGARTAVHRQPPASNEEVAEQKARDEKESIF